MKIQKFEPTNHKIKALIYGASGSGKTFFAGTAKNALFLSAEGGLLSNAKKGVSYSEIRSLTDLTDSLDYLKKNPKEYRTVVIDSISEINDIVIAEIENRTKKQMQLQNWGELSTKIRKVLRGFRDLPMHVIFIALEKNIIDNEKIKKIVPEMAGKAATGIAAFMDIVGYMMVNKTGKRDILTISQNLLLTKDRSGIIGDNMAQDFESWIKAISEIKTVKEQKTVYTDEAKESDIKAFEDLWHNYILIIGAKSREKEAILSLTLMNKFDKTDLNEITKDQLQELHKKIENLIIEVKNRNIENGNAKKINMTNKDGTKKR